MIRSLCVALSVFVLMAVVGCSQYVEGYNYSPSPVTAQIPATQPQDSAARDGHGNRHRRPV